MGCESGKAADNNEKGKRRHSLIELIHQAQRNWFLAQYGAVSPAVTFSLTAPIG